MPGIVEGKVAIVTGGAGGLGLAITTKYLEEGAKVVATDINQESLDALPSKLDASHHDRLLAINVNSTDSAAFEKAVEQIVAKWGKIDILVNNAGVNDNMDPVAECPRAMWDKNILVNVTGPYVTMQATINQMLKQEPVQGAVLNVISSAGVAGYRSGAAYTASKHALVGLTKNSAAYYGRKGIRVLAVMPGAMHTGMGHNIDDYHKEALGLVGKTFATEFPWSELAEVAKSIVVLTQDGIATINGAFVPVDHGWTIV